MQRSVKIYCFLVFILSKGIECSATYNNGTKSNQTSDTSSPMPNLNSITIKPKPSATTEEKTETRSMSYVTKTTTTQATIELLPFLFLKSSEVMPVTLSLVALCIFLVVISILLACKVCHLKSSRDYQVRSNTNMNFTEASPSASEECFSADGEFSETCVMMSETGASHDTEDKGRVPEEEAGVTAGEVNGQTLPEPVAEEATHTTETAPPQDTPEERDATEAE
ncbi:uncharacterized protein LOC113590171 [Electrophorus electricus]|uniref:uncharacterized protein LOC113590171 n=1 Tax=Electrophorus electricus TaxID=8005 RepID=UPI0015D051D1|nr:uncharacterized protein LOC113590171 [Electrophorus electricus]